jgi:nitrite reductase/ring-hydroxylating ferredoxin subunit
MNVTSKSIKIIMSCKSTLYFFTILALLSGLYSCSRERQVPIPYVYVNYTVYLNNPSNSHLRVPGSYLILPDQGNLGIILYRRTLGEIDDFIALDLTCTYEPLGSCKVAIDSTGFYLVCPCCGSKFSVWDGLVATGPAQWSLKEYATSLTISTVRIYN